MEKQKLVVIGNGMAGARFVEEVVARDGRERFDIVMFGEEPYGNYNRILLSSVLAGNHDPKDIFINPLSWYEDNGVKLHLGVKAGWIDRSSKSVYGPGGRLGTVRSTGHCHGKRAVYPTALGDVRREW